jgi:DnaJ-class molecular chaperone
MPKLIDCLQCEGSGQTMADFGGDRGVKLEPVECADCQGAGKARPEDYEL